MKLKLIIITSCLCSLLTSCSSEGQAVSKNHVNQQISNDATPLKAHTKLKERVSSEWIYKKIDQTIIHNKLAKINKHAVYVELKVYSWITQKESVIFRELNDEFRDILREWGQARNWSTLNKEGLCVSPSCYRTLLFLDKNKKIIESFSLTPTPMISLWYQAKGETKYVEMSDRVLPLFNEET